MSSTPKLLLSCLLSFFVTLLVILQDYTLNIFLRSFWKDPRLTFMDYEDEFVVLHPSMLEELWRPDIFFANEKHASFHKVKKGANVNLMVDK